MDLGLLALVVYSEANLNRNDAAETKHYEASRPCCHLQKSVIARSMFATSCRMRASGLRLKGAIFNGSLFHAKTKQECDSFRWGLNRLWLSYRALIGASR